PRECPPRTPMQGRRLPRTRRPRSRPPEAAAEVPPEPAASSATKPTLSPIPGTVARNAPKRS
ncbi:Sec-independent protein translocase TatB, partial [Myxococcus sp. 1LA]